MKQEYSLSVIFSLSLSQFSAKVTLFKRKKWNILREYTQTFNSNQKNNDDFQNIWKLKNNQLEAHTSKAQKWEGKMTAYAAAKNIYKNFQEPRDQKKMPNFSCL